jgi:hypothetical protein
VVRRLIQLHRNEGGLAEGTVTDDAGGPPQPFHGWLELLRLLEAAVGYPDDPEPAEPSG